MNIRHLQLPLALALALGASSAHALGLGQIQVKSGLNQPLVAEIPILSAAPGEVEELEVRLASPEAFARVGLDRPVGMTANLQMSVGRNAAGQPVIRVTTPAKFNEPFLTFLVEANWGRGSLVREFSALVDPPYIAPAVIRPLEAPSVAVAPAPMPQPQLVEAQTVAIEDPSPAPVVAEVPPAPEPMPEPVPAPMAELPPEPVAIAPEPVPEPMPEPAPLAVPAPQPEPPPVIAAMPPVAAPAPIAAPEPQAVDPGSLAPVVEGQTLWSIASQNKPDAAVSMSQMMLALQRANPEAFINGNINQLKRGAVLRIPSRDEVTSLGSAEAEMLVREQAAAWQSRRQPVPQPAESMATAPSPVAPAPRASAQRPAALPDGRLEIVPPSGDELAARGVQSGASGTGTGRELRAELTQAREDLEAGQSEVSELRSQLTELDQQQADSQRLIQMQDSQMKALQDRLGQPSAPVAVEPAPDASAPATADAATSDAPAPWFLNPWILGGGGLVLLGGLVLALRGRRTASPLPVPGRRLSDDDALHASLASTRAEADTADEDDAFDDHDGDMDQPGDQAGHDPDLTRLTDSVAERPDDLETHVSLLRHYYARGEQVPYDTAAQAMRDRVRSTLDPRWREAVVMGVALSPNNALFSQAGWNAPQYGSTGVMPAAPAAPVAAVAAVDIPDLDSMDLASDSAASAAPAADDQDEEWDRLTLAASGVVDTGNGAEQDGGFDALPAAALGDAALDDDASDTKIELAKAYLDIGDIEGARGMLEEVLAEAGPVGRAEAERLLKELG